MSGVQPKILFLTKYSRNGASSRYRTYQYLPWLERAGLHCEVRPLFDEAYLVNRYRLGQSRIRDVLRAFLGRVVLLLSTRRFALVVIEYELLPYFPALPERLLGLLGVPYVVDYDDALFHQYDSHRVAVVRRLLGGKIARVMRGAELVIAGNAYLADYAHRAGARRVEIVPTVVDVDRYPRVSTSHACDSGFTIGWIGSPATAKYLYTINPALAKVCAEGRTRVRLIGSGPVELPEVPVEVVPWSEETEVESMRQFAVGIMPLPDEPWERGKCGFKLVQYMACGLPVIASPVGVNREIVETGVNGFLAETTAEWVEAFRTLMADAALCRQMGEAGRQKVEARYALQVTGPRLAGLLKSIVE